jgi:hypothetical protein
MLDSPSKAVDGKIDRLPIWKRPVAIIVVMVLVGLAFPFIARSGDLEKVFVEASRRLLDGRDMFKVEETAFTYPPAFAVLTVPLVHAPLHVSRAIWYLLNAACIVAFWWASWRLCGGKRLDRKMVGDKTDWREYAIVAIGMAIGLRFVTDVLDHHQSDLLIVALVSVGGVLMLKERWISAAVLVGLAAGFKATPLIFLPYFIIRRRIAAGCTMLAVAIVVNLIPDLFSHPPQGGLWLTRWAEVILGPMLGREQSGQWYTTPVLNQSLAGTIYRLTNFAWPSSERIFQPEQITPRFAPATIKAFIHGSQALVLLTGFGMLMRGNWKRFWGKSADEGSGSISGEMPTKIGLECSLLMLMMVLVSPASSKPHFVIVLLPAYCLARLALYRRDRVAGAALIVAAAASLGSHRSLAGGELGNGAQWAGALTWLALALFLGVLGALWSSGREENKPISTLPSTASERT